MKVKQSDDDWHYANAYRPMCGACKATGIKHVWNAQAVLVPVDPPQPCPACIATVQGFQSDTDHGG